MENDVIDLCGGEDEAGPARTAPATRKRPASQDECICLLDDEEDVVLAASQPQQQGHQQEEQQQQLQKQKRARTTSPHGDAYTLDNCSCELPTATLRAQLHCLLTPPCPPAGAASSSSSSSSPAPTAEAILAACACPSCKQAMTHRDVRQLSGARNMHRLYMALAQQLLASAAKPAAQQQAQQQQAGSHGQGSDVPCASCSATGQGDGCMASLCDLRHQAKRGAGSRGASSNSDGAGGSTLMYAQLRQALGVRGLGCYGKAAALASRLLSHLEKQSGGQEDLLFCLTCNATQAPPPASSAPASPPAPQPAPRALPQAAAPSQPSHTSPLADSVAELWDLLLGEAAVGGKKGKIRRKGHEQYGAQLYGSAAPKGTGYGGNQGSNAATEAAMRAAASRQSKQDEALQAVLGRIRDHITSAGARTRGGHLPSFYLPATAALVLAGQLPHLLRLLLQNDSLQDIASRQPLYRALAELLRTLSRSQDLVEVFTVNTDGMEEQLKAENAQAAAGAGAGAGPSNATAAAASAAPKTTLLTLLQQLNTQCMVYRRSGEELGQGDEDDIARLSMALELSSLYDDVSEAVQVWVQAVAAADASEVQEQAQRDGTQGAAGAAGARAGARTGKNKRQQAVAALVAADNEAKQKQQGTYLEKMRPLLFREVPLLNDHYFRKSLDSGSSSGNEVVRKRLRRITEEISTLSTSLPLSWESSICVAVDTERMDVLRAMVIPAADTPYANGFFVFDIYFPPAYPTQPPMVQFLTTGGGVVRFNPNLYNTGKVCLSLLGTWSGPSWIPGSSTLLQVLISIHALILVSDPYYNEPGYESQMKTAQGKQQCDAYNQQVRLDTLTVALLPALQLTLAEHTSGSSSKKGSLPGWSTFKDAIMNHVMAKRGDIQAQAQAWLASTGPALKPKMEATVKQVEEVLSKLASAEQQQAGAGPS